MLAIRLPANIEQRLQDLALKTGRTKTYYVREALLQYIEEMEDTYLALDRIENPTKIYSHEEVEKEIGLEG